MFTTRTIALGLTLAAVGLTPPAAIAKHGGDDPASHATDDHGAVVEPGDDKGVAAAEPGDDKRVSAAERGDDKGDSGTEPGDDNGGQRHSGSRSAKRASRTCTAGAAA